MLDGVHVWPENGGWRMEVWVGGERQPRSGWSPDAPDVASTAGELAEYYGDEDGTKPLPVYWSPPPPSAGCSQCCGNV
jgi:hypothetical protein